MLASGEEKIVIRFDNIGDNEVKVIFSDDGPGLPNEEMKKVFARGFRLDEQTPGSGLGLNIVKDIIQIYKGKIWLEKSNDLGGLEVNIKLPISFI